MRFFFGKKRKIGPVLQVLHGRELGWAPVVDMVSVGGSCPVSSGPGVGGWRLGLGQVLLMFADARPALGRLVRGLVLRLALSEALTSGGTSASGGVVPA